jgi:hypothetical protein
MISFLVRPVAIYNRLEKAVARLVFRTIFPANASDRIRTLRLVRIACRLATPFATVVLLYGLLSWNSKAVGTAGLIYNLIGAARLFLSVEWASIVDLYADERAYPYRPPSHTLRKLMGHADPGAYLDGSQQIPKYYYAQRGLFFLSIGFFFQLVGLLMG